MEARKVELRALSFPRICSAYFSIVFCICLYFQLPLTMVCSVSQIVHVECDLSYDKEADTRELLVTVKFDDHVVREMRSQLNKG